MKMLFVRYLLIAAIACALAVFIAQSDVYGNSFATALTTDLPGH